MNRCLILLADLALVLYLGGAAYAQGKHGGPGSSHSNSANRPSDASKKSTSGKSATEQLSSNSKLDHALTTELKRKGLMPAGYTSLTDACSNFRNLGQCIAAIHVSHNRGVSFNCLKWDMTNVKPTGDTSTCADPKGAMSLGKSIQKHDPNANAKAEAKKASHEADSEIKQASSSS